MGISQSNRELEQVVINGEHRAFLNLWYYYRYHLVIPSVPLRGL
jgi:hypothetical protein